MITLLGLPCPDIGSYLHSTWHFRSLPPLCHPGSSSHTPSPLSMKPMSSSVAEVSSQGPCQVSPAHSQVPPCHIIIVLPLLILLLLEGDLLALALSLIGLPFNLGCRLIHFRFKVASFFGITLLKS